MNPRRVRLGPQLSAVSSQLGHSQPQRPTVVDAEARSQSPSKRMPPTACWGADRLPVETGVQVSFWSENDGPDPTLLQGDCSGLCNGFSRSIQWGSHEATKKTILFLSSFFLLPIVFLNWIGNSTTLLPINLLHKYAPPV